MRPPPARGWRHELAGLISRRRHRQGDGETAVRRPRDDLGLAFDLTSRCLRGCSTRSPFGGRIAACDVHAGLPNPNPGRLMAFDHVLVERVRERLVGVGDIGELRMFGGWGVTVGGNMAVGVMGSDLIVRVGAANFAQALSRPGARPFDFTGRPMSGWVFVDAEALATTRALNRWVDLGLAFARSLPAKASSRRSVGRTV